MPPVTATGPLYWVQVVGGVLSLLLSAGAILAALYTSVRDAPSFVRRITGVSHMERKLDRLHTDHRMSQHLQLQQAESFNELKDVVCDYHEVPDEDRPPDMDTDVIQTDLMGRDDHDFTRGGEPNDD